MNILRVIPSMNPSSGGPCQGIRYSIPEMNKLGVYNEVVCLDDPAAPFFLTDEFPIIALGKGRGPWQYNSKLIPWLMVNLQRFDAVIVHGLWLYHSYAVRKVIKDLKSLNREFIPKLYIMPHGMLDPYFQKAPGRKLKALRNWIYWKLIERKVINEADGVLFTCEEELKLARIPFRPYHPSLESNVGYGIPEPPHITKEISDSFYKLLPNIKNRRFLLFLGRIDDKKGVDILIKAYTDIWKNYNSFINKPPITQIPLLVIAGPGLDSSYGKKIKNLADSLAPENTIFFPGMLSGMEKWGAFYECEAFILPSHQENFGIAVVEALGCGKPVLISNKVNIWREIENEGGGIVREDSQLGIYSLINMWINLPLTEIIIYKSRAHLIFKQKYEINLATIRILNIIREKNIKTNY